MVNLKLDMFVVLDGGVKDEVDFKVRLRQYNETEAQREYLRDWVEEQKRK